MLSCLLIIALSFSSSNESSGANTGGSDPNFIHSKLPDRSVVLIIEDEETPCRNAFYETVCRKINGEQSFDLPNDYVHPDGYIVKIRATAVDRGPNIQDTGRFKYILRKGVG